MLESLFLWRCRAEACNFIKKETPAQMFSWEFCEIFNNTCFCRKPLVAVSAMAFICYLFLQRLYHSIWIFGFWEVWKITKFKTRDRCLQVLYWKAVIKFFSKLRSSRPELSYKKSVLESFAKFTEKYLHWSLFVICGRP